ncbi:Rho GDP-dissociation inhibitor 1 [Trichinella pseudospiralis]|uniref:Rho GDP-dissociation inhibitor 3 n=1 Tax=Trichinella pseudospiralis TaxID=6337 RepID=A0A0V1ETH2_TRIPS|nr:Rho GDP-dissociation inhibitor 1 [Trichinella pseudospiralis]
MPTNCFIIKLKKIFAKLFYEAILCKFVMRWIMSYLQCKYEYEYSCYVLSKNCNFITVFQLQDISMAETAHVSDEENGQDLVDTHSCYKAPAQKSVQEIFAADADDLSLRKYKEQLLGSSSGNVVIDESNPKNVIVRKLTLIVNGRPDIVMNLEDISNMEKQSFVLKEGCQYHLEVGFHVQREIVAGLKYVQKVYRLGVQVAKDEYMVGSYPPRKELHTFRTPLEEAPSGMVQRGSYNVKSLFTDDDKNVLLKWEWNLEIKKDWD